MPNTNAAPVYGCRFQHLANDVAVHNAGARELGRFTRCEYLRVPWANEAWAGAYAGTNVETRYHFAHVSVNDPSRVAYSQTLDKLVADIQTPIKPGRYLTKFFSHVLSPTEIAEWANKFRSAFEKHELKIARSADDIEHVYTHGPSSCMSHEAAHYESATHPVRAYGGGDLGVAYVEVGEEIVARCVVWPEKKLFGRVYGDASDSDARLVPALVEAGYQRGRGVHPWKGARLRLIDDDCYRIVAPYVDVSPSTASRDGDWLVLDPYGDITLESTTGLAGSATCDRCDGARNEEESYCVNDDQWCQHCYENYSIHCTHCEETYDIENSDGGVHGDEWYCEYCYSNEFEYCDGCDTTVPNDEATSTSHGMRCGDCVVQCEDCGDYHAADTETDWTKTDDGDVYCHGCVPEEDDE